MQKTQPNVMEQFLKSDKHVTIKADAYVPLNVLSYSLFGYCLEHQLELPEWEVAYYLPHFQLHNFTVKKETVEYPIGSGNMVIDKEVVRGLDVVERKFSEKMRCWIFILMGRMLFESGDSSDDKWNWPVIYQGTIGESREKSRLLKSMDKCTECKEV